MNIQILLQLLLPSGRDPRYPGTFTPNPPPRPTGWNMFMEWHIAPNAGPASSFFGLWNDGDGTARLVLRLTGADPNQAQRQWIKDPEPVKYDHWYHVAIRQKWSPDPAVGYPAGNAIAAMARAEGHNGIIYPSVRHAGGTCIAALWPNVVQSVVQGAMYRLTWSGTPNYAWESL